MQVKELNQATLDQPAWSQFLWRSSITVAVVLLGSALIMAIAANWLTWPKAGRVALLELTVVMLTLLTWWFAKRKPKDWASAFSLSSFVLCLAAISIGGLLALIGQSYQTGADPWQLFALWAVLLVPWGLGLRSLFIILLVGVLTNTAVILMREDSAFWVLLLNSGFLALSFVLKNRIDDPYLLLRRLAVMAVTASGIWFVVSTTFDWSYADASSFLLALGASCIFGFLVYCSSRFWNDFFSALSFLAGAFTTYVLMLLYLSSLLYLDSTVVLLLLIGSGFMGVRIVRKLFAAHQIKLHRTIRKKENNNYQDNGSLADKTTPWYLHLMVLGLQLLMVLFLLMLVGDLSGLGELISRYLWYVLGILAVLTVLSLRRSATSSHMTDVSLLLFLMGVAFAFLSHIYYEQIDSIGELCFYFVLVLVIELSSSRNSLLRFCCSGILLFLALRLLNGGDLFYDQITTLQYWIVLLLWVVVSSAMLYSSALKIRLKPLWWATTLCLIGFLQLEAVGLVYYPEALPTWFYAGVALMLPLLVAQYPAPLFLRIAAVVVTAILSYQWLLWAPIANLALAIWLLSFWLRDKVILFFAVILLASSLGIYYYEMDMPLMYKAYSLSKGGALLLLSAAALYWFFLRSRGMTHSEPLTQTERAVFKRRSLYLFLGMLLTVLITSNDVYRKELLLKNGTSLVLALAPVDPRSLMQGDYMTLRFDMARSIDQVQSYLPNATATDAYLLYVVAESSQPSEPVFLARLDHSEVWQWDKASNSWLATTQAITDTDNLAVIRMDNIRGNWLPNGINAWFFAEGSAAVFEQAEYGLFKTNKKGKALLAGVLDEKAQLIAAP